MEEPLHSVHECGILDFTEKFATLQNAAAGLGLFDAAAPEKRCNYALLRTLLYKNLFGETGHGVHGKGITSVTNE